MKGIAGQRFLVTGGAGTIGSTIVDQLVAAGAGEVVVLDNLVRGRTENLAEALASGPVRLVEGDIRDRETVRSLVQGMDVVFHQAAIRINQCAVEPRLALEVLVDGTYEVVEAAADAGVRKVVAASSASVYGLAEEFPTRENHHPYANDTLYGAAKTFNEGLLRSFRSMRGLDYVVLRYFNVYGPRMDAFGVYTEVLIRWMERIAAGQAPLILGDGFADHGFRVHRGHRAREPPRRGERRHRRGFQHRQLDRGQPAPACRALAAGHGIGTAAGVRSGAGRQWGDPQAGRYYPGERSAGLEAGGKPGGRSAPAGHLVAVGIWPSERNRCSVIPVIRPWLGEEEAAAAAAAVASGWIAQGPRVAQFEEAFAAVIGADHAVAVSSCTTALHLAMVAAGVGPGDEVIVPSLSFIATANAVRYVGARPVFADVELGTQNLTAETVQAHLTDRTRAVIVVDQAGVPADIDAIQALCEPRGIRLVQDAACAAGSVYRGRPVGAGAWLATFSFHPRKLLTTGEGGMIVTSDAALAARLRRLREHGMDVSAADRHRSSQPVIEHYTEVGFNFRMTDIQAAVGLVQLGRLAAIVARRRELAQRYTRLLSGLAGVQTIRDPDYGSTNFQSFWILLPEDAAVTRDDLLRLLAESGVSARRGIMAAHLEPAYHGFATAPLPVTERLTAHSLILPLFHEMTGAEQDLVVSVLSGALQAEPAATVR